VSCVCARGEVCHEGAVCQAACGGYDEFRPFCEGVLPKHIGSLSRYARVAIT